MAAADPAGPEDMPALRHHQRQPRQRLQPQGRGGAWSAGLIRQSCPAAAGSTSSPGNGSGLWIKARSQRPVSSHSVMWVEKPSITASRACGNSAWKCWDQRQGQHRSLGRRHGQGDAADGPVAVRPANPPWHGATRPGCPARAPAGGGPPGQRDAPAIAQQQRSRAARFPARAPGGSGPAARPEHQRRLAEAAVLGDVGRRFRFAEGSCRPFSIQTCPICATVSPS